MTETSPSNRPEASGRGGQLSPGHPWKDVAVVSAMPHTPQVTAAADRGKGAAVVRWVTSTDHKINGQLYLTTSFAFFLLGGLMAMLMRAELARPGSQLVSNEQYNQLFTMHRTIMLLLLATPLFVGFANVIMPLQIGAPDVAFPRLNMLSYWFFLFGGLTPSGASSRLTARRLSAGSPTRRLTPRSTRRGSAGTSGSWD